MSRTLRFRLVAFSMLLCIVGAVVMAAPFDPVFRVLRFKGICQVALPGSSDFFPVEPGKAYRYGSTIRTGDAEAVIALCDNHECRVMAGTTARFIDEAQDRTNLTVHLLAGKVEVDLDQKNIRTINRVFVQTAVGIAAGEKARFTVAVSRKNDIHEAVFECNAGMLGVSGAQFQAPVIKEGSSISVFGPTDHSWLRVQTIKGDIPFDVRNDDGDPISYPTQTGSSIKINQRVTESTKVRHVVLKMMKPDGTTETNYTYMILPQATNNGSAPSANAAEDSATPQQGI